MRIANHVNRLVEDSISDFKTYFHEEKVLFHNVLLINTLSGDDMYCLGLKHDYHDWVFLQVSFIFLTFQAKKIKIKLSCKNMQL